MCEYKKWHERIDCDFKNVDLSYFICCPLKWYRFCSYISISLFVLIAFLVFNFTILNQNSNWRNFFRSNWRIVKLKNHQIEELSWLPQWKWCYTTGVTTTPNFILITNLRVRLCSWVDLLQIFGDHWV